MNISLKLEAFVFPELELIQIEVTEITEEHTSEEGLLVDATNDSNKITKATATKLLKEIKKDPTEKETLVLLEKVLLLLEKETVLKKEIKTLETKLDEQTLLKYHKLTETEVKTLVVDDKWLTAIKASIQSEIDAISQRLSGRVKELAERYENTLDELNKCTQEQELKVTAHLQKMGLVWN